MPIVRVERMVGPDVQAVADLDLTLYGEQDHLREELARPWSRLWVAREPRAAVVVGFLASWLVVDELHILNVLTRADWRRRGVGRGLVQAALEYARARSVRRVLLEARRSNVGAMRLYRSVGFYATGVRARYYADDEDAVEMALELDPQTRAVVPHEDEVDLDESSS